MNRPQRLSGIQCLQLLSQLECDESGDSSESDDTSQRDEPLMDSNEYSSTNSDSDTAQQESEEDEHLPHTSQQTVGSHTQIAAVSRKRKRTPVAASNESVSGTETARDGTVWHSVISGMSCGRLADQNVLKETPGPTSFARQRVHEESVASAFKLLVDNNMMQHIQTCTQREARERTGDQSWTVSMEELGAFLSVIIARGAFGSSKHNAEQLWDTTWGPPFFKETMSKNRFGEIMRYLRFDDKSTRSQRLQTDKFCLASAVWNPFISNSIKCYKPGANITVDEQLFPTKVRCRFIQFMGNKPDKFGIKFWVAVDVSSKYVVNAFPYLGRDDTRPPGDSLSESVVMKLMQPYLGKGRNVTVDNFFTSLRLAERLKKSKTSLVGTMNPIRREVPLSAKSASGDLYSTRLLKHEYASLTIYKCKPRRNVIILSTLHPSVTIHDNEKKKPETVEFYNCTKYGVDVVDEMVKKYTVKAGSRRWPVQVFYNLIDFAIINAWILYKEVCRSGIERRPFMLKLAEELRSEYLETRSSIRNMPMSLGTAPTSVSSARRWCQVARCKNNKSKQMCSVCCKFVCGPCTAEVSKTVVCVLCKE
jgi:hypothetical protein